MDILTALNAMMDFYTSADLQILALIEIIEQYGYNSTTKTITSSKQNYDIVRFYALVLICSVANDIELTNKTEAENLVQKLNDIYEAELEFTEENEKFSYLNELQSETISAISENTYALPDLVSYTTITSMPVSVISQELYDDDSREDEIIQMNNTTIIHPLFMPLTIEVLSK